MENKLSVASVFKQCHDLLQDKSRWTRGYYQRDKEGKECPWKEGYSFCALGAICFFTDGLSHYATCALQRISEHLYDGKTIQTVNDDDPQGYEKVLKALEFGMEFWKDRDPISEEFAAPIRQVQIVREALKLDGLPETPENLLRYHMHCSALIPLVDQITGGS